MKIDELVTFCILRGDNVEHKEVPLLQIGDTPLPYKEYSVKISSDIVGLVVRFYYKKWETHTSVENIKLRRFGQRQPICYSMLYDDVVAALKI